MLKLGGFAVSNYYNKVKVALLEKGISFEEVNSWPSQDEDYLKRSPMGKVPYLDVDGEFLCESQVILEYLEDRYPEKSLYPKDALGRARVRELITIMELHLDLVARRIYGQAFFGRGASEEAKQEVQKELAKGVRAFKQLACFSPFVAGANFSLADCAAGAHLPLVSLATKIVFGRDVFEDYAPLKPYLKMLNERAAFKKMNDDRKTASDAIAAARAKKT